MRVREAADLAPETALRQLGAEIAAEAIGVRGVLAVGGRVAHPAELDLVAGALYRDLGRAVAAARALVLDMMDVGIAPDATPPTHGVIGEVRGVRCGKELEHTLTSAYSIAGGG
jgi:hypothetical protein